MFPLLWGGLRGWGFESEGSNGRGEVFIFFFLYICMAKRMGERVKGVTLRFMRSPSFDKYWVIVDEGAVLLQFVR